MPKLAVQEFIDDEAGYLAWVRDHPEGLVLNTSRERSASYMVLHRATCATITKYSKHVRPGGFTGRTYIKVCALDVESLREWIGQHGRPDGTFTGVCGECQPLPQPRA